MVKEGEYKRGWGTGRMGKEGVKKRLGEWENGEGGSIKEAGGMGEWGRREYKRGWENGGGRGYITRLHLTQQEVNGPLILLLLLDIPPAGL